VQFDSLLQLTAAVGGGVHFICAHSAFVCLFLLCPVHFRRPPKFQPFTWGRKQASKRTRTRGWIESSITSVPRSSLLLVADPIYLSFFTQK
jgi:hypothetical protein